MPALSHRRAAAIAGGLIVLGGLVAYANSLGGPFVFDDLHSILDNPTIRRLWPLSGPLHPPALGETVQGRPVLNLSLALNYAAGGTDVWGYHVVNLLIHLLAALTLFGILRRTGRRLTAPGSDREAAVTGWACAIAVVWTVHPLQTESVTYVIQRAESLMGLFYLLTLYGFIRGVAADGAGAAASGGRPGWGWLAASTAACLLGMGTKEVMVSAPVIVFAYDGLLVAPSPGAALRRRWGYYLALAATWIPLAILVAHAGNRGGHSGASARLGWIHYWLTQPSAIAHYVRLAFWPTDQMLWYRPVWVRSLRSVWPAGLVVAGLAVGTAYGLRRSAGSRGAAAGWLGVWFFALLAPTSLVPGTLQTIAEHRMYLALIPLLVAGAGALQFVAGRCGVTAARNAWWFGLALAVPCAVATHRRNADYATALSLYFHDLSVEPDSPLAQGNVGFALMDLGRLREALPYAEAAARQEDSLPAPEYNLGLLLEQMGRPAEAEPHFRAALKVDPGFGPAADSLFILQLGRGRREDAIREMEHWLRAHPSAAAGREATARSWENSRWLWGAIALHEVLVRLYPGEAESHNGLGIALTLAGRAPEAIACYREALRLQPNNPDFHYNLAQALLAAHRRPEAIAAYREALKRRPDFIYALCNLGDALLAEGRPAEAVGPFRAAARVAPGLDLPRRRLRQLGAIP